MNICRSLHLPVPQALLELPGEQARNRIKSQLLAFDGNTGGVPATGVGCSQTCVGLFSVKCREKCSNEPPSQKKTRNVVPCLLLKLKGRGEIFNNFKQKMFWSYKWCGVHRKWVGDDFLWYLVVWWPPFRMSLAPTTRFPGVKHLVGPELSQKKTCFGRWKPCKLIRY